MCLSHLSLSVSSVFLFLSGLFVCPIRPSWDNDHGDGVQCSAEVDEGRRWFCSSQPWWSLLGGFP
ncbi:hypothetical protein KC19_6G074700 [Ceratodon purpureus]|uniref:Secreted protein n=1 Tax=Ceratodon purpureus TaxID=3225 RepID=A0A8T0HIC4_CERPU|nr:hypothetical protein KC19_6G074700 [Ceratodon purpureus]